MHLIIVSDIFGRTAALESFASEFPGQVEIIDPYNSEIMGFDCEDNAYSYFTTEVGLDVYADKLSNRIKALTDHVTLLGFSVGASAIWKLSHEKNLSNVVGAALFYSSQIRYYTDIEPLFPICLVFPKTEVYFSVSELIQSLKQKENVEIHHSSFLHGFMNYHSRNYNATAYNKYTQALCNVPFNKPIQATAFGGA
jgi:dienelactone hydrolase